jgi:hypothetical protein
MDIGSEKTTWKRPYGWADAFRPGGWLPPEVRQYTIQAEWPTPAGG